MTFFEYGIDTEKPILSLCKPDRTVVAILNEAYNIEYVEKIGEVSLLDFNIPYFIEVRNQIVSNKNIILIKERYLIKYQLRNKTEYLLIQKVIKNHDNNSDYITVECAGLPIQLTDRLITNYKATSKNATQLLADVLLDTSWGIGSIDADFDIKFRSFEFTGNVYNAIMEIGNTFEALVDFNTINKTVNFYVPDEFGFNKGFVVAKDKLIKSIKYETNSTESCTRLIVRGKDGTSIRGVTSTGSNYLQNYSYYLDGFQKDANGNVLKSSSYMSDSLASALTDYLALLDSNEATFQGYLTQLETLNASLTIKRGELSDLEAQLDVITDTLDTQNSTGQDPSATITQKINKENEIAAKEAEIADVEAQINTVQTNITNLGNSLAIENHLTTQQLLELDEYIIVREYVNEYISDPKELREAAELHFKSILAPKILVDIDIVNLFEVLNMQNHPDLDKVKLGDIINIKYDNDISVTARITEIRSDFENGSINLVISNVQHANSDEQKWIEDINVSIGNSFSFAANKYAYDNAVTQTDEVTQILNNTWSAIEREIKGGLNESVSISRRGIWITDSSDPNRMVVLQNSVIGLSRDGGNRWTTALTPDGIIAERLIGQIIAANNLIITNSGGTFNVNSTGVTIAGTSLTITGGLPDNQIKSSNAWNAAASQAANSVQLGTAYNNVVISAASGVVATRSDVLSRTIMSGSGFAVQKNVGTAASPNWQNRFYTDANGDLIVTGNINATSGTFSGNITATGTITGGIIRSANFENGAITGSTLTIGSGNSIFKADTNGIYLGSSSFSSAPFRVRLNGSATFTNVTIEDGELDSPNIYGAYIEGGQIRSNTSIEVTTDLVVGNNIILGARQEGSGRTIKWANGATIYNDNDGFGGYASLVISASTVEIGDRVEVSGSLLVSGTNIITEISDLWDEIDSLRSDFNSHRHTVTTPDHNHGNPDNVNSGGGTFTSSLPR